MTIVHILDVCGIVIRIIIKIDVVVKRLLIAFIASQLPRIIKSRRNLTIIWFFWRIIGRFILCGGTVRDGWEPHISCFFIIAYTRNVDSQYKQPMNI